MPLTLLLDVAHCSLHQKSEASDRKCVALAENVRRLKHELLTSKTEVCATGVMFRRERWR